MKLLSIILYLILILFGISFAVLNAGMANLNLYLTTLSLPLSLLVTLSVGLGVVVGALLVLAKYWRLRLSHKYLKNQLKLKEEEISNLRSIPLKDEH